MSARRYRVIMGCLVVIVFVVGGLWLKTLASEREAHAALAEARAAVVSREEAEFEADAAVDALVAQCRADVRSACKQLDRLDELDELLGCRPLPPAIPPNPPTSN